jgi:protein-disulfide isomerase
MQKALVNFGAALLAALSSNACNSANSTQRAEGATPSSGQSASQTGSKTTTSGTNDPIVAAADKGRVAGEASARTWVVIASDFQCPFCRQWHSESYKQFVDEYVRTGKVKVAYINYPLGQHQNAVPTAMAAMCASAQNKFWQYHDALFESQARWQSLPEPRPVLDSIARTVGVDFATWAKCVDTEMMRPLVFADRERAAASGVQSTPTFIIGRRVIAGTMPLNELRPFIDSAIVQSGTGAKQ